ncbi:MAG: alpha/beta hydrolase [Proteobacteria bacterium]|nr:alpha/beta hydrolase [Pseudomonadota bacterium]
MAYKQFVPLVNLNFQINRLLTYGEAACREEELWEAAQGLQTFDYKAWYREWHNLALRAEGDGRILHAAYYHRLSEFFLPDDVPEKQTSYQDFRRCFYQAVDTTRFDQIEVPYEGHVLPVLRINAADPKAVVLLHGGFDSFVEEFYPALHRLTDNGYSLVVFEGPGQGRALRDGLKMNHDWEKPVGAVLDHLGLDDAPLIGVSLGGYLALRAAAFEPRISRVVAYDVVYDALECFTSSVPEPMGSELRRMIEEGRKEEVNALFEALRRDNDLVDWVLTHGMYITGQVSPFDYFHYFLNFNTRDISRLIRQDVLLLAGEHDHFVPLDMYYKQKDALTRARSVRGRIFTAAEGGDQHCQVGNVDLAFKEMLEWLDGFYCG